MRHTSLGCGTLSISSCDLLARFQSPDRAEKIVGDDSSSFWPGPSSGVRCVYLTGLKRSFNSFTIASSRDMRSSSGSRSSFGTSPWARKYSGLHSVKSIARTVNLAERRGFSFDGARSFVSIYMTQIGR